MQLDGKTALLTGATGGLGRAMAEALAARGATVVLSSRKPEELDELALALPGEGHRRVVTDLDQQGAAEQLAAEAGEVDVLVANAGLGANGSIDAFSPEEIERVVRVNLEAPIRMARAYVPAMRERGSGHIVFVSSLAGKAATPKTALYTATKAGLRGFAISLRQDLARDGIGVSIVCPGFVRDAGMFARSGRTPPMNLGTTTPGAVAEATVCAIEHDKPEVDVAPFRQRFMANFAGRRPHLASRISGGAG
jgi:short-subunit dehydrogenase